MSLFYVKDNEPWVPERINPELAKLARAIVKTCHLSFKLQMKTTALNNALKSDDKEQLFSVMQKCMEKNKKQYNDDMSLSGAVLQEVDDIFIRGLRDNDLYDKVWQAGCMLLPVQSVGVMGDERTYESVVALRAVESVDGMTADWCHLPYEFLAKVSNDIINRVKGVNRVVYDISSKPPATIEWE